MKPENQIEPYSARHARVSEQIAMRDWLIEQHSRQRVELERIQTKIDKLNADIEAARRTETINDHAAQRPTHTPKAEPVGAEALAAAPKEIYLQWHGDAPDGSDGEIYIPEVSWSREKVFGRDVRYVRADEAAQPAPVSAEASDTARLDWVLTHCHVEYHTPGVYSTEMHLKTRSDIDSVLPKHPAASAPAQFMGSSMDGPCPKCGKMIGDFAPHACTAAQSVEDEFGPVLLTDAMVDKPDAKRYSPFDDSPEYHDSVARGQKKPDAKRDAGEDDQAIVDAYNRWDNEGPGFGTTGSEFVVWLAAWDQSAQATRRRCKEAVEAIFHDSGYSIKDQANYIAGDYEAVSNRLNKLAALLQSWEAKQESSPAAGGKSP